MSFITVIDLPKNAVLDRQAMLSIRGGNGGTPAGWLYGAFKAYDSSPQPSFGSVGNVYQVTNNFHVEQMISKSQEITINNAGANSNITAVVIGL